MVKIGDVLVTPEMFSETYDNQSCYRDYSLAVELRSRAPKISYNRIAEAVGRNVQTARNWLHPGIQRVPRDVKAIRELEKECLSLMPLAVNYEDSMKGFRLFNLLAAWYNVCGDNSDRSLVGVDGRKHYKAEFSGRASHFLPEALKKSALEFRVKDGRVSIPEHSSSIGRLFYLLGIRKGAFPKYIEGLIDESETRALEREELFLIRDFASVLAKSRIRMREGVYILKMDSVCTEEEAIMRLTYAYDLFALALGKFQTDFNRCRTKASGSRGTRKVRPCMRFDRSDVASLEALIA